MAKQKRTVIVDKMNTGTNFVTGMSIELAKATAKELRKAISKNIEKHKDNLVPRNNGEGWCQKEPIVHFSYRDKDSARDSLTVNDTFYLNIPVKKGEEWEVTSIQYTLRERGNSVLLQASSNPSVIAAGSNAVPVVIAGMNIIECHEFQLLLPFHAITAVSGFEWKGKAANSIRPENVRIQTLEFALYTGNLGDKRDAFLLFLRTLFGTADATTDGVRNGGHVLGISAVMHENHDGNISLTVKNAQHRYFSITYYCKDEALEVGEVTDATLDGLSKRVRMDIRLHGKFLDNNGLATVASYVSKLTELVGDSNDDAALGFWLRDHVLGRLHIGDALRIRRIPFYRLLDDLSEDVSHGDYCDDDVTKGLLDLWLNDKLHLKSVRQLAQELNTSEKTVKRRMATLNARLEEAGVSLSVPLGFLEHALYSGATASLSKEERREMNRLRDDAGSNKIVKWSEMHQRFAKKRQALTEVVFEDTGALKLTRVPAKKVYKDKLYIHQFLP